MGRLEQRVNAHTAADPNPYQQGYNDGRDGAPDRTDEFDDRWGQRDYQRGYKDATWKPLAGLRAKLTR